MMSCDHCSAALKLVRWLPSRPDEAARALWAYPNCPLLDCRCVAVAAGEELCPGMHEAMQSASSSLCLSGIPAAIEATPSILGKWHGQPAGLAPLLHQSELAIDGLTAAVPRPSPCWGGTSAHGDVVIWLKVSTLCPTKGYGKTRPDWRPTFAAIVRCSCSSHKPHTSLTVAAAVTDMQAELHLIGKKVSCMEGRQAARQLGSNFINPIGSEEFSSKIITLISLLSIRGETHKW